MSNKSRQFMLSTLLPIAVLVGLILLFFNKMALSNLILARGDTFLYFYPYWHAASQALREAHVPFWNPAIFMGAPMLANSQIGFFYPLNWPVWLLLRTPYAVSVSILLHILIAAVGVYLVSRRVLLLSKSASLVAALSFALGGYLTAQVEHINQLQGLAWLPWFLLAVDFAKTVTHRSRLLAVLAIGGLFALQLLAGHTQTTFITSVAILIWILAEWLESRFLRVSQNQASMDERVSVWKIYLVMPFLIVFAGGLLALALSAFQLLPTLELMRYSSRTGGLPVNEVLSFSLPPQHLTDALLPTINQSLFSEYIAFLPIVVIFLAFIGGWQWRRRKVVFPALAETFSGLFLALGAYNPLYWLLARLPGFSFFRAPARWLVLYALGISFLAGIGWHLLWRWVNETQSVEDRKIFWRGRVLPPFLFCFAALFLLAIWGFAASSLIDFLPLGSEAPFEQPSLLTMGGWMVEGSLVVFLIAAVIFINEASIRKFLLVFMLIVGLISAFLASRSLPYNNLTTPEAYFDLRPSITRLMAESGRPPERLLSLSNTFFDPGDQVEIESIYGDQLSNAALYDYIVAIKQKEIIAPNLPMIYDLASIDGFDGGILPLRSYSRLVSLLLADGQETTDGRLREYLDSVPDERWLDLFNARYLITDKTGDVWHDGVYFDRQHPVSLRGEEMVSISYLPDFEANEVRLLASAPPDTVNIMTVEGESWSLQPQRMEESLYHVPFPRPATLEELSISACSQEDACTLEGLTLVDSRDGIFYALVPGSYRLIHSGDVKIYENTNLLPRAFFVHDWQVVRDSDEALATLLDPDFDVRSTAVIEAVSGQSLIQPGIEKKGVIGQVTISEYQPERVVIQTDDPTGGLLVLTDAQYPGWSAVIDGQTALIYVADGLFRGVFVPPGTHEVVFVYKSRPYLMGLIIFILSSIIITIVLAVWLIRRPFRRSKM